MLFARYRLRRFAERIAASLQPHLVMLARVTDQRPEHVATNSFAFGFLCISVGIAARRECRFPLQVARQGRLLLLVMTRLFGSDAPELRIIESLLINAPHDPQFRQGAALAFEHAPGFD